MRIRQQRKTETREALLESAARVFARRGYHDASLEEIARDAGRTTGSVYSSFRGKDDLFLSLIEGHIDREMERFTAATEPGEDLDELMRRGFEVWLDFVRREPDVFLLAMEFWSRAARDPEIRDRYVAARKRETDAIAAAIERALDAAGLRPLVAHEHLAVAAEALADGLAMRRLVGSGPPAEAVVASLASVLVPLISGSIGGSGPALAPRSRQ